MHDKVSVVDIAFGFLPGSLFRGQNLLLCKLLLFLDQISRGRESEVSEGAPPVEEGQASDSIMLLSNSVNNRFSTKMRISHHYL